MKTVKLSAYAKINLFLDITGRRENGYHEIDGVMQTVDLCDEIVLTTWSGEGIEVVCDSSYAPDGKENIVYRAAEKYLIANNIRSAVKIELIKNIPSPSGLGGGSADAAAVLRGLNGIYRKMNPERLEQLALSVGSDVPFCIRGGTQRVRGVGEVLEQLKPLKNCYIVIACGRDEMPTPAAYKALDEKYGGFYGENSGGTSDYFDFENSLEGGNDFALQMYNIFENVTLDVCPSVAVIKGSLMQSGALGTLMSGSGPAVFGIFDSADDADLASKKLFETGVFSKVCKPVFNYR
jgi:4-diphosphocytidyl-2-C-methyl-D-erythritol kinase